MSLPGLWRMQQKPRLWGPFLWLLSWAWVIGYFEEIKVSDQLITTRRQHQDGAGDSAGNVAQTERAREGAMPGRSTHTHKIQALRDAAKKLIHMHLEHILQTDTEHTRIHCILSYRTQTPHIGSHTLSIYLSRYILPRHTAHPHTTFHTKTHPYGKDR